MRHSKKRFYLLFVVVATLDGYSGQFAQCNTGSPHCINHSIPINDVLPETAAQTSVLRSGTTSHNGSCAEKQIYQSENVVASLKHLALKFNPNHAPIYDAFCNQNYTQTSGTVYTQKSVTKREDGSLILHGAISVIAKINPIITGIWPAIWLLPQDTAFTNRDGGASGVWPMSGEIDTIEMAGYNAYFSPPETYFTTLHFGSTPGADTPRGHVTIYNKNGQSEPLSERFHRYTMEWNITLKNTQNASITALKVSETASIQLTMYLDGKQIQSDRRIWNSYTPDCDNGLVATGVTNGQTCGLPEFSTPSAYMPLPSDDALPLQVFINGFNSGFRLIINVASGGGIFFNDPVGAAGATEPVTTYVKSITASTIENMVFVPNIFNGAIIQWLEPIIPGEVIDHYQIQVSGYNVNMTMQQPAGTTQLQIPAHTFYGNRDYHVLVMAVAKSGTMLLVGENTTKIRP